MKNFKVLTLFLILALTTSSAMFVDGKAFSIDLEKQQTIFEDKQIIEQNDLTQKLKHNFIALHKSISIQTNDERKTIMERIFDGAKLQRIVFDSSMQSIEDDITLSSLTNEHQYEQSYSNLKLKIDQRIPTSIIDFSISENYLDTFYVNIIEINDQLIVTTNSLSSVDNPMFMLLVLSLAGFVLVRTENEKLNFNDLKRVFCFVFVTILISSAIITPLSISSAYWGVAFAEEFLIDNQTSSNSIPASATDLTSTEPVNATTVEPTYVNATSVEPVDSNATSVEPVNATSVESVNATTVEPAYVNATSVESVNATTVELAYVNATSVEPVNTTSVEPPQQIIIPEATVSLQFEEPIPESIATNSTTSDTESEGILVLDGQGDFIQIANVTVTNDLSGLTVTVWVKPDYSQGSPEFTVLSKEKSFALSINNLIKPQQVVKFSVFDGIKWTTIESTSIITENWSFLSSTFDGESIAIFVNGTREGTKEIVGVPTLSISGKLETSTVDSITSEADIVIGATITTNNENSTPTNQFSGEIDDVLLYDYVLDDEQIRVIYNQTRETYEALDNIVELTIEEIIAQIEAELAQNSTTAESVDVNATQGIINATDIIITDVDLQHDVIEIGKSVTWTQTVTLSNETDIIAIEIPEDAQITKVTTVNSTNQETTLYEADVISSPEPLVAESVETEEYIEPVEIAPRVGLYDEQDIIKENIDKLEIINATESEQVLLEQEVTLVAVLEEEVPELLQEDMPTKFLLVNETSSEVDVTFETPAPYTLEEDQSTEETYNIKVTVAHNSTLHYDNVKSYSDIPEDLVEHGVEFKLYWNINGTKTDVTHDPRFQVEFVDTDGNGIVDQIQWIVPLLSEQEFEIEAEIIIINVQSHPGVGGNWEVRFNTTGTADLTITAINGTTWNDVNENDDLKFLKVTCGGTIQEYEWVNNSVFIPNYSCNEMGYETSKVLTYGAHHLMFQFGNDTAYAHNSAGATSVETYTITLTNGETTEAANLINGQTITNAIPFVTYSVQGKGNVEQWENHLVEVTFASSPDRVIVTRDSSPPATMTYVITVVQFDSSSVKIQSGSMCAPTAAGCTTTIGDSVVVANSALVAYHRILVGGAPANGDDYDDAMVRAQITGTNQLTFSREAIAGTVTGTWYVMESLDGSFSVQTADIALTGTETTDTDTITSVDTSKTFLIASYDTTQNDDDSAEAVPRVELTDSTTITATRGIGLAGLETDVHVFAITFSGDEKVQRGTISHTDAAGAPESNIATLTAVDTAVAMPWSPTPWGQMQSSSTAANSIQSAIQRLEITDSTTITGTRGVNVGNTIGSYEVIEWVVPDTVAPTLDSAATGPNLDDITYTFSESMDTGGSIVAGDFADVDSKTASSVSVSGSNVIVTFSDNFATDFFTATSAERFQSSAAVDDTAGNSLTQGVGTTSVAITDGLAPTFDLAMVGPNPNQLTYIFSENIDSDPSGSVQNTDFAVVDTKKATSVSVAGNNVIVGFAGTFASDFTDTATQRFTVGESINDKADTPNSLTQGIDTVIAITGLSEDEQLIGRNQITHTVNENKPILIVVNSGIKLASLNIPANVNTPILDFSGVPGFSNSKKIIFGPELVITALNTDVLTTVTIPAGTQITGTVIDTDGSLILPTADSISITDVDVTVSIKFGDEVPLTFTKPIKITIADQNGLLAFITEPGGEPIEITGDCDSDNPEAEKTKIAAFSPKACVVDPATTGDDLTILTLTASSFSSGSRRGGSSSTGGGSTGSDGGIGIGPGLAGASGFGVILFSPLRIHEISYDVCSENMAAILIANDDAVIPTVLLHTTKSGTIEAVLATEQPFEERNKLTTVDKYLFLAPLDPEESFFMVQVKAISGAKINTVNIAVHITECQGIILFDEIPEEFEGIEFLAPRIFDVKIQIDNGTLQSAISPEVTYLDEQELTVSAIVNSQVPLKRVELRYVIAGQSEDDYIAFLMDINPLEGIYTAAKISASIPPVFMVAPGIEYWIHVMDVNLDEATSQHYTMGVKPEYDVDASLELDIPTSKPEGSTIRPSAYVINHAEEPAFGTVSLLVDGKVVSSITEFFGSGETKVTLEWVIPKERQYMVYAVQAKLDLYGTSATTEKAYVSSFMKTQIISLSEMQTIQPITNQAGNTVAQPALLYASDSEHDNLRFRVIGSEEFCFIGATNECAVKESTFGNRGGIQSIEHNGIIYRVKYSGADSPLERFSITSVDKISSDWNITLESVDGFIPQAYAMEDIHLKVKYRTVSEMITVS